MRVYINLKIYTNPVNDIIVGVYFQPDCYIPNGVYIHNDAIRMALSDKLDYKTLKSWKYLRFVTRGTRLIKSALDED